VADRENPRLLAESNAELDRRPAAIAPAAQRTAALQAVLLSAHSEIQDDFSPNSRGDAITDVIRFLTELRLALREAMSAGDRVVFQKNATIVRCNSLLDQLRLHLEAVELYDSGKAPRAAREFTVSSGELKHLGQLGENVKEAVLEFLEDAFTSLKMIST